LAAPAVAFPFRDAAATIEFGVLMTPATAVDGEVKAVGRAIPVEEIKAYWPGNVSK
jgi:hypothetical protein